MRSWGLVALVAVLGLWSPRTVQAADRIEIHYDNYFVTTLENGLDVLVIESREVPIVTIELAARNGSFTEPPEWNGLSHLYEHMFFKANALFPSQEAYLARQRELGMVFNGTTSDERVNYYFTLQSAQLREGLEFMAAAIRTPQFDPEELERERMVVWGEFDRNESNPYFHLWDATGKLLWFEHPSRKDALGDRATVASATVEQMREMQQLYYVPNNMLLVIAGDVEHERGFELAREFFGSWERGEDPFVTHPVPEHPPLQEDVAQIVEQPVNVSVLQIAWHGPDTRNDLEATWAADVFSYILDQDSSGFQQRLVESGVALSASFGYQTQRYVGPIYLTLVVVPGTEAEALAAVREELERFSSPDYFEDHQIETAQTLLAISEVYAAQNVESLAHTASYWWCSADLDYHLSYVDNLYRVDREAIQRFVETWVVGRPRTIVALVHPELRAALGLQEQTLLDALRW